MAIQAESFIALENSLTLRLQRSLNAATAELYPAIQGMILKQEWAAAESAMRELQLAPLVALNRDYITYLSRLSALFGASRINTTPANSLIGLGIQEPELASNVDSFQRGMVENVQAGMIDSGLAFINAARGDSLIQKADNVVREFAPFMDEEGKAKFNMAASLHTSRLASFGFTAEARFLGITEYQITEQLDGRTCPVCRIMHGKKFKVADARRFLSGLIREKDPEQIKELQPWPSQSKDEVEAMAGMSTAELVANGWHVPPFHPRCRGLLVKVGKAPSLDFPITVPVKEPYEATNDDFLHLGFDLSPTKVKTWNQLMRTSPMEILSKLLGLTQEEVFNKIQGKADPAKALGLRTLAVTQTGVNIELLEEAYGSGLTVLSR